MDDIKSDITLYLYKIEKNKKFLISCLILLYLVFLPLIIQNSIKDVTDNIFSEILCFSCMERYIYVVFIIITVFFNREYIDKRYYEIILSMDKSKRLRHYLWAFLLFNFVMIPFYLILYLYIPGIIKYFFLVFLQEIFLISFFYVISTITNNLIISEGGVIFYILFFSFFDNSASIFNIFLFEESIIYISNINYIYLKILLISLLFLLIGLFIEGTRKM